MDDIVARLEAQSVAIQSPLAMVIDPQTARLMREAAAEIQRLRSAPAGKMAEALRPFVFLAQATHGHYEMADDDVAFTFGVASVPVRHLRAAAAALTAWEAAPDPTQADLVECKKLINGAYSLLREPDQDAVWQISVNAWLQAAVAFAESVKGRDRCGVSEASEPVPDSVPTPDPATMRDYIIKLTAFYMDNPMWTALANKARGYVGALDSPNQSGKKQT